MTGDCTIRGRLKFCGVVLVILTPFLLGSLLFEHLLERLNVYFTDMDAIIREHGGSSTN